VSLHSSKQSNGAVGRKLNYLHTEGQFLLLPIEDSSELRTVSNLRQDRVLAEQREAERREVENEGSERSYEVEPVMTADTSIEDVEAQAQAIINGNQSFRAR